MSKKKVCIIESDVKYVDLLTESLGKWDVEILVTGDGGNGIKMISQDPPDLIVLAIELPSISGYSVCKKVKRKSELSRIPLIITSSTATPETFEQHKKLKTRAEGYLHKPFSAEAVQEMVLQVSDFGETAEKSLAEELFDDILVEESGELNFDNIVMGPGDNEPSELNFDDIIAEEVNEVSEGLSFDDIMVDDIMVDDIMVEEIDEVSEGLSFDDIIVEEVEVEDDDGVEELTFDDIIVDSSDDSSYSDSEPEIPYSDEFMLEEGDEEDEVLDVNVLDSSVLESSAIELVIKDDFSSLDSIELGTESGFEILDEPNKAGDEMDFDELGSNDFSEDEIDNLLNSSLSLSEEQFSEPEPINEEEEFVRMDSADAIVSLGEELRIAEEQLEERDAELGKQSELLTEKDAQILSLRRELHSREKDLLDFKEKMVSKESEALSFSQKIAEFSRYKDKFIREIRNLRSQVEVRDRKIKELVTLLRNNRENLREQKINFEKLSLEKQDLQISLDSKEEILVSTKNELDGAHNNIKQKSAEIDHLQKNLKKVTKENVQSNVEFKATKKEMEADLEQRDQTISELHIQNEKDSQAALELMETELEKQKSELTNKHEKILQSVKDEFGRIVDEYDGDLKRIIEERDLLNNDVTQLKATLDTTENELQETRKQLNTSEQIQDQLAKTIEEVGNTLLPALDLIKSSPNEV